MLVLANLSQKRWWHDQESDPRQAWGPALAKSVKVPEFSDSQTLQAAEALQQTKSHLEG